VRPITRVTIAIGPARPTRLTRDMRTTGAARFNADSAGFAVDSLHAGNCAGVSADRPPAGPVPATTESEQKE
jgi:hypothetical protein